DRQEFRQTTVEDYAGCFVRIQCLWKENKKTRFSEELQKNLATSANPYKLSMDRLSLADEFLGKSPTHQKEILLFIDDLIGNKDNVDFKKFKVKDLQKLKSRKLLCNIVARLLKRYNFDSSICPHFQKHRATGGLRYLFYKYYVENSIQKFTFDSLVADVLEEHPDLKTIVMDLFVEYCDLQAAVPYVARLQLTSQEIPQQIKNAVLQYPHLSEENKNIDQYRKHTEEEELWDDEAGHFYSLSIPSEKVVIIDTVDSVERCTKELLSSPLLGIDTEWKPTFGTGAGEQAALLQLATTNQVFLLDLISLQPVLKDCHWHLIGQMFSDPQITKLGYGIKGDFKVLGHLHAELKKGISNAKNVIDFDQTKSILVKECPNIFSHSDVLHKGLSDLIYRCFGLPLDKKEQFSNWAARPLTKSQLMYAALDVRCLLDVYAYLNQQAQDLNIPNWKDIKHKVVVKPKTKTKPTKSFPVSEANTPQNDTRGKNPVNAADFQVICDTMVQGLAKQLRSCGIDAKALDNGESCDRCIEYFEKEKRVVLTRGGSYRRLLKYIPAEYVYNVQSEVGREQLAEVIKAFNIKVTVSNVFARCVKCNSDEYMFLPTSVLVSLHANTSDGIPERITVDEWVEYPGGKINLRTGLTSSGVSIQVGCIPNSVLQRIKVFCVCSQCGKCYWEGTHHNRIITDKLKDIIEDDRLADSGDTGTGKYLVNSDVAPLGYQVGVEVLEGAGTQVVDTTGARCESSSFTFHLPRNELPSTPGNPDSDAAEFHINTL
ncbi:Exonuclease mut-7-like, partial [Homarus americanus]